MATMQMQPAVQPVAATSEGTGAWKIVQGFREGTMSTVDFKQRMIAAGYGFGASMGSVTTPLTFLVTAANRPDAWLRVPATRMIIPTFVGVTLESMTGTVTEIDVRITQNDIGNGTSTAATVGPINLRGDSAGLGSGLVVPRQLATGDTTAETNPLSVYRRTYIRADDAGSDWKGIEWAGNPAPFVGNQTNGGTLEVFIAATTNQATGFVVMQWVETPMSWWV